MLDNLQHVAAQATAPPRTSSPAHEGPRSPRSKLSIANGCAGTLVAVVHTFPTKRSTKSSPRSAASWRDWPHQRPTCWHVPDIATAPFQPQNSCRVPPTLQWKDRSTIMFQVFDGPAKSDSDEEDVRRSRGQPKTWTAAKLGLMAVGRDAPKARDGRGRPKTKGEDER